MPEYDAIIVGTGQAGPALARRLTAVGMKVAIVERHKPGGTCVNTGCTPTKTLLASAYAAHMLQRGPDFGLVGGTGCRVDMKLVQSSGRLARLWSGRSEAIQTALSTSVMLVSCRREKCLLVPMCCARKRSSSTSAGAR